MLFLTIASAIATISQAVLYFTSLVSHFNTSICDSLRLLPQPAHLLKLNRRNLYISVTSCGEALHRNISSIFNRTSHLKLITCMHHRSVPLPFTSLLFPHIKGFFFSFFYISGNQSLNCVMCVCSQCNKCCARLQMAALY